MNKKIIWIVLAAVILGLCGYLLFRNKPGRDDYVNPDDSGILEVGLNEEKEESTDTNTETTSENQEDKKEDSSNTEPSQQNEIPAGGEAVDAGDGSVNIVMNEDEEAFGE